MASIADQSVEGLGGSASVLTRQRADHVELDELIERASAATGDEQDALLQRMWRLVFRHAYAEETVLWPVMRRALPDGEELTLRVEQEHQEINELVARLDRTHRDDPGRPGLLQQIVVLLRRDVRDEEDVLLPRPDVSDRSRHEQDGRLHRRGGRAGERPAPGRGPLHPGRTHRGVAPCTSAAGGTAPAEVHRGECDAGVAGADSRSHVLVAGRASCRSRSHARTGRLTLCRADGRAGRRPVGAAA